MEMVKLRTKWKRRHETSRGDDTLANVLRRQIADDILDGRRAWVGWTNVRWPMNLGFPERLSEKLTQLFQRTCESKPRSGAVYERSSQLGYHLCVRRRSSWSHFAPVSFPHYRCGTGSFALYSSNLQSHTAGNIEGYALENRKFHSIIAATQNVDLVDRSSSGGFALLIKGRRLPEKGRQASQDEHQQVIEALEAVMLRQLNMQCQSTLAAAIAIDEQLGAVFFKILPLLQCQSEASQRRYDHAQPKACRERKRSAQFLQ